MITWKEGVRRIGGRYPRALWIAFELGFPIGAAYYVGGFQLYGHLPNQQYSLETVVLAVGPYIGCHLTLASVALLTWLIERKAGHSIAPTKPAPPADWRVKLVSVLLIYGFGGIFSSVTLSFLGSFGLARVVVCIGTFMVVLPVMVLLTILHTNRSGQQEAAAQKCVQVFMLRFGSSAA